MSGLSNLVNVSNLENVFKELFNKLNEFGERITKIESKIEKKTSLSRVN